MGDGANNCVVALNNNTGDQVLAINYSTDIAVAGIKGSTMVKFLQLKVATTDIDSKFAIMYMRPFIHTKYTPVTFTMCVFSHVGYYTFKVNILIKQ